MAINILVVHFISILVRKIIHVAYTQPIFRIITCPFRYFINISKRHVDLRNLVCCVQVIRYYFNRQYYLIRTIRIALFLYFLCNLQLRHLLIRINYNNICSSQQHSIIFLLSLPFQFYFSNSDLPFYSTHTFSLRAISIYLTMCY